MGVPILLIGKSGSGKSASLRNFPEAGVINVMGKPLPFKNAMKTYDSDDYQAVCEMLVRAKAKSIVIDDAGYLITNQFMRGHAVNGTGNAKFNFFDQLADNYWNMIQFIMNAIPREKIVYVVMHEERNADGDYAPRVTGGKLLVEKVCIEGMFTIAIRSMFENGRYYFRVHSSGEDIAKTPMGMFDTDEIDNDLKLVDDKIREYYNFKEQSDEHLSN